MLTARSPNPVVAVLAARRWNPYVVGVLIGVLSWLTFLTMDRALGTSSSFVHMAGFVEGAFVPTHVVGPNATPYFVDEISGKSPMFDWQVVLVGGIFLGAFVSSRLSGDHAKECVPSLWAWRFGSSKALRYGAAFVGGVLLLFGARMAGGCTSGHGLSGGLQLALSSWTFLAAMCVSGIATALLLFGTEGRRHVHS
jgi:uncharacterized membrane protein YedE/YeeE